MIDVKERVLEAIKNNKNDIIAMTQDMIRYPSLTGNEKDAQHYYANILETLSFDVDVWDPIIEDTKINPDFLAVRDDFQGSPNVVGVLKGKGGGKSIILNGHIDVVPVEECGWLHGPWSGKLEDGKIFGRGASDMKGGLVAYVMAIKSIIDSGVELKGDVIIQSVIGEETGGAGTLSAISRGYKADGAIVSEPTDLRVCPVSMGAMWFRVIVKGIAAHAGTAELGVNAISKACIIIQKINEFDELRAKQKKHELYEYASNPFNVNIGKIIGGTIPSSVPGEVIIEGRIAVSPEEEVSEVRKRLEEAVYEAAERDSWLKENVPKIEWYGFCLSSGGIDKDHELVKTINSNYRQVMNSEPSVVGTPWGTDAGALIRYGNIPTLIFGPGPGGTAHQANECVDVDTLLDTTKVIACTVLDWCGFREK